VSVRFQNDRPVAVLTTYIDAPPLESIKQELTKLLGKPKTEQLAATPAQATRITWQLKIDQTQLDVEVSDFQGVTSVAFRCNNPL
jgi:hypothetical protein